MKILSSLLLLLAFSLIFGEVMRFDIDYIGVTIARVSMTKTPSKAGGELDIVAKSSGLGQSLSQMDNRYRITYAGKYVPYKYTKKIVQKDYFEDREIAYKHDSLKADRIDKIPGLRHKRYGITRDTREFFSALYNLRVLNGTPSGTMTLDAAGLLWKCTFVLEETETISTVLGKIPVNRYMLSFSQITAGEKERSDILTNNLVNPKNKLYLWVSKDSRAIPVKAEYAKSPFSVMWHLTEYQPN